MTAVELFANDASTTVTSGGSTAPATGTVETWTVTSSASFPAASSGASPPTQFHVADPQQATELIAVTNITGTSWLVTRGAEGTTPVAHPAGFTVRQVISAGTLGTFLQLASGQQPVTVAQGGTGAADAADALDNLGGFPESQTITTVSNGFSDLFEVASAGGTDTVGPLELTQGGQTINSVLGQAYWFGYNALQGSSRAAGANGAATLNFYADAGDTNVAGHGVEINLSWFGPGTTATGAFQMVAVNDDTNTVNTTIRCGTGNSGGQGSVINFTNGDASKTFLTMNNQAGTATFGVPMNCIISSASTNNAMNFEAIGSSSAVILTLEGNNGNAINAEILFAQFGVGTAWNLNYTAPNMVMTDSLHSRTAMIWEPGTSATTALVVCNSHFQVLTSGSLICGSAALATTATDGFLYLPTCSGAPTGTPTTKTGTAAHVYDTTNHKLWVFDGGWKGVVVS